MTKPKERDLKNAMLTLLFEWKSGIINTDQAIKEISLCVKYYAINDRVMMFQEGQLRDKREFEALGDEKTIGRVKEEMLAKISKELMAKECVFFEEHEAWAYDERSPYRKFMMKVEALKQPHPGLLNITQPHS